MVYEVIAVRLIGRGSRSEGEEAGGGDGNGNDGEIEGEGEVKRWGLIWSGNLLTFLEKYEPRRPAEVTLMPSYHGLLYQTLNILSTAQTWSVW